MREDRVDPVRDDERRPGRLLREEVAQRPVERARHADRLAVARHERERALDARDVVGSAARDARPRLLDGHVRNPVDGGIGEVVDAVEGERRVHRDLRFVISEPISTVSPRTRNHLQWRHMASTSSGESTPAEGLAVSRAFAAVAVSARPPQWVKNLVVALPVLFGAALSSPRGWWLAAAGVVVFCAVSSGIYV